MYCNVLERCEFVTVLIKAVSYMFCSVLECTKSLCLLESLLSIKHFPIPHHSADYIFISIGDHGAHSGSFENRIPINPLKID